MANVLLARQADYQKAASQYQKTPAVTARKRRSPARSSRSYTKSATPRRPRVAFRKAIWIRQPNYWSVYSWLGQFYYGQARYARRRAMYKTAIELAPDNYRGFSNLGAAYVYEGRYRRQHHRPKHSIELRPTPDAYGNLGATYYSDPSISTNAITMFQEGSKT